MIFKKKENTNVEIGDIEYFSMYYTKGYMINSDIRYRLEFDEEQDKYLVTIKPHGISEEDSVVVIEPSGFKDQIKEILIKYEVNKWNGFSESDKDVLDGDSFGLHVRFKDETTIDASGYMSWPENYRLVRDEMDKIFMNIYNKEKGIKEDE